ncbi:MAG: hypothetical protein AAGI07_19970 [Bacteroidota bacterium]
MKRIYAFILFLFTISLATAQDYFVAHVKGDIEVKGTNKKIAVGDQLKSADELRFITQDAKAVVMTMEGKRMVIDGKESKKSDEGEFISFVQDVVLPLSSNIQLSTRGGNPSNIQDFKTFFGEEKYVIIGDALKVKPDPGVYPLENGWSFIYRYETGSRPVNKIVANQGNEIILDKNQLYKTKGVIVDPEKSYPVKLFYFNSNNKDAKELVTFHPVFVDENTLNVELKSVATFLENNNVMKGRELMDELYKFVLDVHGPINKTIFFDWLSTKELITKG